MCHVSASREYHKTTAMFGQFGVQVRFRCGCTDGLRELDSQFSTSLQQLRELDSHFPTFYSSNREIDPHFIESPSYREKIAAHFG